jgi:phospholipid/cholesterol/gamma-HCH transport system substrate-binding protein
MVLSFSAMEKVVGTFVILVLVLLLSMVVLVGRGKDWFRKNVTYQTTFGQSYDLDLNSSVKLFNADIGKVKKINLVGDRVTVTMAIYEDFASRIRQDSTASVEGISYIGKKFISIKPGSESSPLIEEDGEIPSIENKSITDLLKEFEIEKTAKMVIRAVQDLSEITARIKQPEGPLFTAMASVNKSLEEVEKKVGKIMANVEIATGKTPKVVDQVQADLEKVHEIGDALLANIAELKKIIANIEKGSKDIPPVTGSVKNGVSEIRAAVENIDQVVLSLKKNILIRSNIPPEPQPEAVDAGMR